MNVLALLWLSLWCLYGALNWFCFCCYLLLVLVIISTCFGVLFWWYCLLLFILLAGELFLISCILTIFLVHWYIGFHFACVRAVCWSHIRFVVCRSLIRLGEINFGPLLGFFACMRAVCWSLIRFAVCCAHNRLGVIRSFSSFFPLRAGYLWEWVIHL